MLALQTNSTWDLVSLPSGKKVTGCKWVYTIKVNLDGTIARLKALLVAKSYAKTYVATHRWPLYQLDVKNAFLYGDLKEKVYMEQQPRMFSDVVLEFGLSRSSWDHTMFFRHTENGCILLVVCVDDIVITSDQQGIHDLQDIFLSQNKYVLDLLKDVGLLGAKPCKTPMESSVKLIARVGGILSVLSQFMSAPTTIHWDALVRILKSQADRKSTTGYCLLMAGNLVSWKSKKQNVVARSSAEFEYCTMALTTCELMWISHLLEEIGFADSSPMSLWW
ncbi:Cysteine-rich RLK (RECEPTOR-like protein kinase) 8 [Theobroma cacao]|uniref:Cysteine-rich RLK (RECEPTOR-like protein kinase) 8 n=1 Tax=Theobroma cacao TaxID=3641 RepID=A0A061DPR5_THECC|nr:Cysteine-rich RLK (RECEPTOR-like protein kinase) 8 [Theobroma cacao]